MSSESESSESSESENQVNYLSESEDSEQSEENSIQKSQTNVQYHKRQEPKKKKKSKGAPAELSSKIRVSTHQQVVKPKNTAKARDPRFDPTSGELDEYRFQKSYSFLDDYQKSEINQLKQQLRKEKNGEERDKIGKAINIMENRNKEKHKKMEQIERIAKVKKEERLQRSQNSKNPFYLKKSEEKKIELIDKFTTLKTQNKLGSYMKKKRQKRASKDVRYLPYARRTE